MNGGALPTEVHRESGDTVRVRSGELLVISPSTLSVTYSSEKSARPGQFADYVSLHRYAITGTRLFIFHDYFRPDPAFADTATVSADTIRVRARLYVLGDLERYLGSELLFLAEDSD